MLLHIHECHHIDSISAHLHCYFLALQYDIYSTMTQSTVISHLWQFVNFCWWRFVKYVKSNQSYTLYLLDISWYFENPFHRCYAAKIGLLIVAESKIKSDKIRHVCKFFKSVPINISSLPLHWFFLVSIRWQFVKEPPVNNILSVRDGKINFNLKNKNNQYSSTHTLDFEM